MALTPKEAVRQIIDALPDDASLEDVAQSLSAMLDNAEDRLSTTSPKTHEQSEQPVDHHLERRGRFTVIVPDRPAPPLTVEMVNQIIDDIRREREESFIYPLTFSE